jgi:hypothetical protein
MLCLVVIERMRSARTVRVQVVRVNRRGRRRRVIKSPPCIETMAELQETLEACRMLASA